MQEFSGDKKHEGVTLIELLIILVIVGVTLSLAMPAYQAMTDRNMMATQTNDMLLAINMARSEALRIGGTVSVQATASVAGDEFGEGWCVVVGNPGSCAGAARSFGKLGGITTLNSVSGVSSLQFNSLGALSNIGTDNNRSLDMCSPNQPGGGRRIYINAIGRSKSHKPTDLDTNKQPVC